MRFTRISFIFLTLLLLGFDSSNAQTKFFGRVQAGTPASTDPFEGASVGLNAGTTFKGLEIGLGLDIYARKWNNALHFIQVDDYEDKTYTLYTNHGNRSRDLGLSISANIGYNLLNFVKSASSHHLTPFVTLGYAQRTLFRSSDNKMDGLHSIGMDYQAQCGFEMSAGCRYEYDITKSLSIGAFYQIYLLIHEKDFVGLSLKYSLPVN